VALAWEQQCCKTLDLGRRSWRPFDSTFWQGVEDNRMDLDMLNSNSDTCQISGVCLCDVQEGEEFFMFHVNSSSMDLTSSVDDGLFQDVMVSSTLRPLNSIGSFPISQMSVSKRSKYGDDGQLGNGHSAFSVRCRLLLVASHFAYCVDSTMVHMHR
jgi:hypothetical protein